MFNSNERFYLCMLYTRCMDIYIANKTLRNSCKLPFVQQDAAYAFILPFQVKGVRSLQWQSIISLLVHLLLHASTGLTRLTC